MYSHQHSLFAPAVLQVDPFSSSHRDKGKRGLLALDVATITGWCDDEGSGIWDFTIAAKKEKFNRLGKEPVCLKNAKFKRALISYITENSIKIIAFERPIIYRAAKRRPNFVSFELIGILKLVAIEMGIKLVEYNAAHIKKFATGIGNCLKQDMINACITRYKIIPIDDNEADAIHLYHLAIQDLKI